MVIFRELGIAIFDSTAPNEYFPSRAGNEIIEMYELLITPGRMKIMKTKLSRLQQAIRGK